MQILNSDSAYCFLADTIAKNDRAAGLEWLRKSARQGHQLTRTSLGGFLRRLPSDDMHGNLIEAYAWFSLAGANKSATELETRMTAGEIGNAQKMAAEYLAKYGKSGPLVAPP